jgi:DNA end-binding protein Ku
VVLTDEDFKRADVEATRTIDILDFVDADEVDMMYFDKPYYLEPDKGAGRPYVLLREALAATNRVGIAKVVIRTRQHLAAVEPKGKALVLNVMRFQDELVDPGELDLPEKARPDKREVEMAKKLIDNLTEPWDPKRYTDDYRKELLRVIHEKVEGREVAEVEEPEPEPKVIDIMSALKASLDRTGQSAAGRRGRASRSSSAGKSRRSAGSTGRKRTAAARAGGKQTKRLRKAG